MTKRPLKQPVIEVSASDPVQVAIDNMAASGGGTVIIRGNGARMNLTYANGVDVVVNPTDVASSKSAEQEARDMLERIGVENAQSFTAGDLVELANLIAEVERLRRAVRPPK
jgi:hypothetical protein